MSFEALLANLSERAGVRGREFERICKWFLRSAPEYRTQLREVWLWDEWPGRWAADAGIDLVAETVEGGLWAIQAKAYDPAYTIRKADIDSFLSESARSEIGYRLLIATTDGIGHRARRTLDEQEKPAGVLLRSKLALAEVAWPASPADLRPRPASRKRPRRHQRKAVTAIVRSFRSTERGQLVMACGTGKTLIGCFLAEALAVRRVLVLVPSLSLLAQTLREWALTAEFSYLAVCSDDTVTRDETDAVVAATSELGFPVTTDPALIARFLRRRGQGARVVFATYQSSPRIAEAQASGTPAFDLVIGDEAHRCAGPQAGAFGTVLDARKIKARKRLFMTATPRYFTGRIRNEAMEADWEIASMDDETLFGPVLHRLSFGEAIEQGLLSDYQVAVVGVSDTTYREYAERGMFVTADGETVTDARKLASQLGLLRAMANYRLHRIVSFHSRIGSASAFARSLPEVCAWLPADRRPDGLLWAEHVSGQMTSGQRDSRLNRLRAVRGTQRGVLSNARCLAEGVDVPTLDGVAFIEPRRSQIDIVQAVGRAIRKAPDKTIGTIVIPVFVDENEDPALAIETSAFERVWRVVNALRAHDDALAEELDELRRELGQRQSVRRPKKIKLDVPVSVGDEFARAFDTRLVQRTTAAWPFWYGLLQNYATREGHARPPRSHLEDGYRLGIWVAVQRRSSTRPRLSAEQIALLEQLSLWTWRVQDFRWEEAYRRLRAYAVRTGSASLEARQQDDDGFGLGHWTRRQQDKYQRGELEPERAELLEMVPDWQWSREDPWATGLGRLIEYVKRTGDAAVLQKHRESNYQLGRWVSQQRKAHQRGELDPDRAAKLEALPGWAWEGRSRATEARSRQMWETAFRHLLRFVDREGHARVPFGHIENGFWLAEWVSAQRTARSRNELWPELAARLEALPGWSWHPHDDAWEEGFEALTSYAQGNGVASPPLRLVHNGYALGQWAAHQRRAYSRGRLDPDRAARLEQLAEWRWQPHEASWETGYSHLLTYVQREGHATPVRTHIEDAFPLGRWAHHQRTAYRNAKLNAQRTAKLDALFGWSWNRNHPPRDED